jgi:DNA-binding CsgD family transcriptional regulator
MEVFRQAAAGLSNKEVAARLTISQATVKAHLSRIFQKLGLRRRSELVATYHGLVPPAPNRTSLRNSRHRA